MAHKQNQLIEMDASIDVLEGDIGRDGTPRTRNGMRVPGHPGRGVDNSKPPQDQGFRVGIAGAPTAVAPSTFCLPSNNKPLDQAVCGVFSGPPSDARRASMAEDRVPETPLVHRLMDRIRQLEHQVYALNDSPVMTSKKLMHDFKDIVKRPKEIFDTGLAFM